MGLVHSPLIVRDGLILHLDAANSRTLPTTQENLLPYSNFTTQWNGYCGNLSGITNNTTDISAPDGTNTATKVVTGPTLGCDGTIPARGLAYYQNLGIGNSTDTYTVSLYVRGAVGGEVLNFGITDNRQSTFTLTTAWQRLTYTGVNDNTDYQLGRILQFSTNNLSATYYVWGAQLERGSVANSYVPTNGTAITRGTIVSDLTNNGNNGTLQNGVGYSSDNFGSLVFRGTNESIRFGGTSRYFTSYVTQQITVETWIYVPSSATWSNGFYGNILTRGYFGGSHGLFRTTTNNIVSAWFRQTGSYVADRGQVESTGTIERDKWTQLVAVWKAPGSALYINGNLASENNTALADANATATDDFWYAGLNTAAGGNNGNFFTGNQASCKIYNRALTASEVKQNFDALRGRYGI